LKEPSELIISTGFAGALRKDIAAGDLVLDRARSNHNFSDQVADIAKSNGMACHQGSFYTSDQIVSKSRQKIDLGAKSGAVAVDMESQSIFEVLRAQKAPLLFLRAVSDEIDQDLPDLSGILGSGGELRPKFLMKALLRPLQWPDWFRLAVRSKAAEKTLARIIKESLHHV